MESLENKMTRVKNIRNYLIIGVMLLMTYFATAQTQFKHSVEKEYFAFAIQWNPGASINWKDVLADGENRGLHIGFEAEYVGVIYAKVGAAYFEQLTGGYRSLTGSVGTNFSNGWNDKWRYYVGGKFDVVFRQNQHRVNPGVEGGVDFRIEDDFFIGLRTDYMKRFDQEIFGWKSEMQIGVYVKAGFRFDWIPKNQRR